MRKKASCSLLFLLALFILECSSSDLECTKVGENLECKLVLPLSSQQNVALESCISQDSGDDRCVKAQITVSSRRKISTKNEETTVVVGSQKYVPPYSRYGEVVAATLHARPRSGSTSWDYGAWLVDLGLSHRTSTFMPTALDVEASLNALHAAKALYGQLEQEGKGDSRSSVAGVYASMAESMLFHPENFREEAIEYYRSSEKLYKEILDEDRLSDFERVETEVNWADVLVRLGVMSLEQEMIPPEDEMGMMQQQDMDGLTQSMKDAELMLETAVNVFRRSLARDDDKEFRQMRLANALQNYASTTMMITADMQKAAALLEEAIEYYQKAFATMNELDPEYSNVVLGVAEAYYSLADAYLQSGKYQDAKNNYQKAMAWHRDFNVETPPMQTVMLDSDESLDSYEKALDEYMESMYGGREVQIPEEYRRPGEPVLEANELYEADLHATLGALRMSRDESHLAMNHFARAVELYEKYQEVEGKRPIADVKLNMAVVHYRQQEYAESMQAYFDAVDIYHNVVGEGKNPIMDGFEQMMAEAGLSQDDEGDEGENVQQRLINLDSYRASIHNATASDEL